MKGLYAIPLGVPFLKALVDGLIAQSISDPLLLARYLIILPTRRGCRTLQEAFLRASSSKCRILPRIIALADIEEGADLPGYISSDRVPLAIPKLQRLGLLSQLVLAFEKQKQGGNVNPVASIHLTQELIQLIDEIEISGASFTDVKNLMDERYATHWQEALNFLKIIIDTWPAMVAQEGFVEPAMRQRMIIEKITHDWHPDYPVILAGTTASRDSTSQLAAHILRCDKGSVVLPGVDLSLSLSQRQSLPPTHPQYTLSQFILQNGVPSLWPTCSAEPTIRSAFLSKAMTVVPQEDWRILPPDVNEILSHFQAIEASNVLEEARQIALIMRYELETPDQTIALVTPDTELARRVQAELSRWHCLANMSNGMPFAHSLVGRFIVLSSLLTQNMKASDILALLKHPLCQKARDQEKHLKETRKFEMEMLRGKPSHQSQNLFFPLHQQCKPLIDLNDGQLHALADFLQAHLTVLHNLIGEPENEVEPNASLLWKEEDGQVAFTFWEALKEHVKSFPALVARDYTAFLVNLMNQEVVRYTEGVNPRLLILGALEARLLQADVVILGGINEETWPGPISDNPWFSRSMRDSLGLPSLERKIGLSAHDFCTAMSASKIYITRSLKRNGAPSLPSRWWQRLAALLSTSGKSIVSDSALAWHIWSKKLDEPVQQIAFIPPAPCPPIEVRPQRLSVTSVETLLRDPYSIYAKSILKLKPLDPLDADLSVVERGRALHQVVDTFVRLNIDPRSPDVLEKWEFLAQEAFKDLLLDPRAKAFWWPRLRRVGQWFLNQLIESQHSVEKIITEEEGAIDIMTTRGPITLIAKADRIDVMISGHAQIVDYKTGNIPKIKEVRRGLSPQLALEGVILSKGGFSKLSPLHVEKLLYWRMTGGVPAGEIISFDQTDDLLQAAEQGVQYLFEMLLSQETPFYACPNPEIVPNYHDYGHLERLKEWQ